MKLPRAILTGCLLGLIGVSPCLLIPGVSLEDRAVMVALAVIVGGFAGASLMRPPES